MATSRNQQQILSRLPCTVDGCLLTFPNLSSRTQHYNHRHRAAFLRSPSHEKSTPNSPTQSSPPSLPPSPPGSLDNEHIENLGSFTEGQNDRTPDLGRAEYHPKLCGRKCDRNGNYYPTDAPAPSPDSAPPSFEPFDSRIEFEIADFLYRKVKMPAGWITELMHLWAAQAALTSNGSAPFRDCEDLYETIDSISQGDAEWKSFSISYRGEDLDPHGGSSSWKYKDYEVWYRDPRTVIHNMLGNPNFKDEFDYAPFRKFNKDGKREFKDFMSGDYSYQQADKIFKEFPSTDGNLWVPVILGSDKTTVSVATGQNDYYPLYLSIGNIHNNVRRAHRESVIPIGFLSIPKSERKYDNDRSFLQFRRKLFHTSLETILNPLKPFMADTPDIVRCPDGHFRRVTYGLGPYIVDYPEQTLLACVVQGWCPRCTAWVDDLDAGGDERTQRWTNTMIYGWDSQEIWDAYGIVSDVTPFTESFPRADIHQLLAPDLLHQIIKGTFKDHLVAWIGDYLVAEHGESGANAIWDDIDKR